MSKSVVSEIQSHITVMMPVKSTEDFKAVKQILQAAAPPADRCRGCHGNRAFRAVHTLDRFNAGVYQ